MEMLSRVAERGFLFYLLCRTHAAPPRPAGIPPRRRRTARGLEAPRMLPRLLAALALRMRGKGIIMMMMDTDMMYG